MTNELLLCDQTLNAARASPLEGVMTLEGLTRSPQRETLEALKELRQQRLIHHQNASDADASHQENSVVRAHG